MATKTSKFKIQKGQDGELRVYLYAPNGHLLMVSAESFAKKSNGERMIARVVKAANEAAEVRLEPDQ